MTCPKYMGKGCGCDEFYWSLVKELSSRRGIYYHHKFKYYHLFRFFKGGYESEIIDKRKIKAME